ncbi:hypothetical protein [Vannielia litorea]|uniref:hypothetical protein n=1 Tax=Vannielia litorea TaxID=1217970 RepID=UPI001C9644D4|nr:hypothetical protein [Vannielia litorea]MBY6047539.1 hypothetical protein [Vannielia litorea]MBY6074953.1 hypothetical protein [Vannielia litorea]
MDFFERLTGFVERGPERVRENLVAEGGVLRSRVNGRVMRPGVLERVTSAGLGPVPERGASRFSQVVEDAQALHLAHPGALFQVASQFNLLEMIGPDVTPAMGITRYAGDPTQGPACAIACAAGTIWRNYFAEHDGYVGQCERQIDCLAPLGQALGNEWGTLWEMRNGYALPHPGGLEEVQEKLLGRFDDYRGLLEVGLQRGTEVTLEGGGHEVHQVYCSALPVAYGGEGEWQLFARLVLEEAYEITLGLAARLEVPVFLTLLGGGAFGNDKWWILEAMGRAMRMYRNAGLDVRVVSYRAEDGEVAGLIESLG